MFYLPLPLVTVPEVVSGAAHQTQLHHDDHHPVGDGCDQHHLTITLSYLKQWNFFKLGRHILEDYCWILIWTTIHDKLNNINICHSAADVWPLLRDWSDSGAGHCCLWSPTEQWSLGLGHCHCSASPGFTATHLQLLTITTTSLTIFQDL